MNLRRIIAICMIILSVFLQVSYAVGNSDQINISSDKYRVRLSSVQYDISDEFGVAKISIDNKNDTSLDIKVDNLYPGIYFNIKARLENIGSQSIKVTGISLVSNNYEKNDSNRLYDMIVGRNDEQTKLKLYNYIEYLNAKYRGSILNSNQSIDINLSMGMDEEITDMENAICEYQIIINFEQTVEDNDEDEDDDDDDDNNDNDDDDNNDDNSNDGEKKDVEKDDNNIHNKEPINSEEKNTTDNNIQENNDENTSDTSNTLSVINVLPKSGEKLPISLYIAGLALMFAGIYLLRKENKTV